MSTKGHAAIRYVGTAAERAALATGGLTAGVLWIETDTLFIYRWDGTTWQTDGGGGPYLRLDASNDPVTAGLEINAATTSEPVLILQTTDDDPTNPFIEMQQADATVLHSIGQSAISFQPAADSTTFFQILDADGGNPIFTVDSTNERVGIGIIPTVLFEARDSSASMNVIFTNVQAGGSVTFGIRSYSTGAVNADMVFTFDDVNAGGGFTARNAVVGWDGSESLFKINTGATITVNHWVMTATGLIGMNEASPGAKLHITSPAAATIVQIVEGAAAQSANLAEWRDSASGIHTIIDDDGVLGFQEDAAAPTAVANYGKIWTQADNILYFQDGAGVTHPIGGSGLASFKSYNVTTQGLGAGVTIYAAGFYESSAADANLTQASTTVTFGSANISYAAHSFIVAGGAGVTDGSDLVLTVTGVSITDAGVRTVADSEVIVADCTAAALNQYFEGKKWLGQITFTLSSTGGTAFSFDFNYGLAKYEDFGNRDFTVTDFEAIGYAGANETNLNIQLCHHTAAGWTYNAAAFVPGPAAIVQLSTDHSTDDQLASGEHFAYKRTGLSTAVSGSGSEGVLARITTTANNAIEYLNVHIGVEF